MRELQRLTTEYVETEDRVRISGELAANGTVVMWLSQRLLVRLLPHLFLWLEKQSDANIPMEIEQSFAQEAVKAELNTEAPVQSLPESQEWLVEAVDLTPNENMLSIRFRTENGNQETLRLQAFALRQWLEIIHSLWRLAEWPFDVWPEWIASNKPASKHGDPAKLH
tara:strand:- start:6460 stop:6960 length:501 start_codon:yes stop_codon:yes gene_type:complete